MENKEKLIVLLVETIDDQSYCKPMFRSFIFVAAFTRILLIVGMADKLLTFIYSLMESKN